MKLLYFTSQSINYILKKSANILKRRHLNIFALKTLLISISLAVSSPSQADLIITESSTTESTTIAKQRDINQIPTDESILKLMHVKRIDKKIEAIIRGQEIAVDAIEKMDGAETNSNDEASERQKKLIEKLQTILGQYSKVMVGGIENATDSETLTQAYIDAAKKFYTQNEVDAQIKFYDTPIGQSILDKEPQVSAEFLQSSLPNEGDMEETQEQLEVLLPQLKELIDGIF